MSVITTTIPPQAFEVVRDRIAVILKDEIDFQAQRTYDSELEKIKVWSERFIPFDKTELPAINIAFAGGNYSNQHPGHADGQYTYNIQVYTKANTGPTEQGDSKAIIRLERVLGICRYILEDPKYKTLGFSPPFVMRRQVDSINIGVGDPMDAQSAVMGMLTFSVRVPESCQLIVPALLAGYISRVKMEETDKGYVFTNA